MGIEEKTGLVLGGGGSRGAYELGVWKALRELGIEIQVVVGTSIGAINGALVAQGDFEKASALWDRIETSRVVDVPVKEEHPLRKKVWRTYQSFAVNFIKKGGTDTDPLKRMLYTFIDEAQVRESEIEYGLVTIEMDKNVPCELFREDIPYGKMIDYMLASASIYPAFKPYKIDDVRYLDGAYYDNLPVKMALEKGAGHIIAVDLEAFGVVKKEMLAFADHLTYIRCYWSLGPTLVFDRKVIRRNIRLGYLDTMKAFQVYEGCAFTFLGGFGKRAAERLSGYLPLDGLLEKGGVGFVLDRLFLMQVERIFEEHGTAWQGGEQTRLNGEPAGLSGAQVMFDGEPAALVCAEVAGEVFGLSSETVYSYETWREQMESQIRASVTPEPEEKEQAGIVDALYESAKTLADRRFRAVMAGRVIADMVRGQKDQLSPASISILPEAFLAGVYLAAEELV